MIEVDADSNSDYFKTTQTKAQADNSGDYGNKVEAFVDGAFYNRSKPGSYISTDNEFIEKFVRISSMTISILGMVGHIFSLIIFFKPPFNELPHSIFCTTLACVDLVFYAFAVRYWFDTGYNRKTSMNDE